ncbi:hypothetical protein ABUW04_30725 [Streptacidiphilus sp. N1-10]|uniref:Integral membrane protein n=1 Tax=Streptacidiphilus jeojiensis TaxID=3229225 RepID=A0ABV6XWI3_9ACTN
MTTTLPARLKTLTRDVLMWGVFVFAIAATVSAGRFFDGAEKSAVTWGGIALSLLMGTLLAQKPRIKAFLSTRPVLWFLFLFNGAVAAVAAVGVGGTQGAMTAGGMGLVALGAAFGLLSGRRNRKPARA